MKKLITLLFLLVIITIAKSQSSDKQKAVTQKNLAVKDTVKKGKLIAVQLETGVDTLVVDNAKYKLHKKNVSASYYHDKFNGRKTSSGIRFDNNKYTAAHRKFPFGTKLKVTNEVNGKSVIVEVIDRGPFTKGRELDLTRRAFFDIAAHKGKGVLKVTIAVQQ
ncbi:septal ring lytic transglycosylase RlpA family protein [Flavobacterium sp. K5-23]|uniref:septal ring lytic transglycosylase RlpA family protein n=1 Tax=Flavobacterium sp. K5-23 TaxID=2746225 RepID=UPI00201099AA|nr:septal ring lytic transglycosylase RlpA family protein [Flavobacterium sp. K5-23]UQD55434.1 septal ring lytic transglycosylase RlpA family protein [Flavobacterium sp. K5-23]